MARLHLHVVNTPPHLLAKAKKKGKQINIVKNICDQLRRNFKIERIIKIFISCQKKHIFGKSVLKPTQVGKLKVRR